MESNHLGNANLFVMLVKEIWDGQGKQRMKMSLCGLKLLAALHPTSFLRAGLGPESAYAVLVFSVEEMTFFVQ